jgi:hypothetical protein
MPCRSPCWSLGCSSSRNRSLIASRDKRMWTRIACLSNSTRATIWGSAHFSRWLVNTGYSHAHFEERANNTNTLLLVGLSNIDHLAEPRKSPKAGGGDPTGSLRAEASSLTCTASFSRSRRAWSKGTLSFGKPSLRLIGQTEHDASPATFDCAPLTGSNDLLCDDDGFAELTVPFKNQSIVQSLMRVLLCENGRARQEQCE